VKNEKMMILKEEKNYIFSAKNLSENEKNVICK
jgi:hypothetical protein